MSLVGPSSPTIVLSQELSVDEAMIKYKGHIRGKVIMPNKPIKAGFKVWCCCCCCCGYLCTFQVKLGYGALKDLLLEVIKGIATGRDVFAVLPTGYGKSLCYGCLPLVFDFCIIQQNIPLFVLLLHGVLVLFLNQELGLWAFLHALLQQNLPPPCSSSSLYNCTLRVFVVLW